MVDFLAYLLVLHDAGGKTSPRKVKATIAKIPIN